MTTLDMPPAPSAGRRPTPAGTRFVDVRANLMPAEVISARQVDVVRKRVLLSLAAVVALVVLGFGASWYQTHSARSDLADLNRSIAADQRNQQSYAALAQAQTDVQTTRTTLAQVMANDLSWRRLLQNLDAAAPAGLRLTSVAGSTGSANGTGTGAAAAAPAAGTAGTAASPLNPTGVATIGTLTLSGTARDQRSVAAYSDALGSVPGLTAVMVTSVSGDAKGTSFTITAALTSKILGGRFTPTAAGTTKGGN